ncbi:MAG: hypothetical protein AABX39_00200 [Nanoarchaeota archaeon]
MKTFDTCLDCEAKLKKVSVDYRGTKLEALQCPKCKQKIFTEEQTLNAINNYFFHQVNGARTPLLSKV